jgi:hypothetical protein
MWSISEAWDWFIHVPVLGFFLLFFSGLIATLATIAFIQMGGGARRR